MTAIELQSFSIAGLKHVERPRPAPGLGQLLVRIEAVSLNPRDLEIIEGRYAMPVDLPVVPLSDAVGVVAELGPGTTSFSVGDRVNPVFFPDWQSGPFRSEYFATQLGAARDGVLQEFLVADESAVVRAPGNLGDEAATLPIAAVTAWRALQDAQIAAGNFVLILGSGGVSTFALQFAAMLGARAVVIARGEERVQKARELGAAHVIDRARHPSWSRQVIDSTGGQGADIVIEVVGRSTFGQSSESLAVNGRIAVLGYLGGAALEVDVKSLLIGKRARLLGQTVGSRKDFDTMNRAIEAHGMTPIVDQCHELADLRAALERVASGDALGKVIVRMPR